MEYIKLLLIAAALIYGGIIDYRKREIPDLVHVVLLIVGTFFGFSPLSSIIGLVVPAAALLLLCALRSEDESLIATIPGGDFKLLCALGYALGLAQLAIIVLLAVFGATVYGFIKQKPINRSVPLCTYVAPAYIVLNVAAITLG